MHFCFPWFFFFIHSNGQIFLLESRPARLATVPWTSIFLLNVACGAKQ